MSKELDGQHREIVSGVNYAKRIQDTILPSATTLKELLVRYAILHRPKQKVSGDFYLCDKVHDKSLFGVVDCTGKGVTGVLTSIVAFSKIEQAFHQYKISDPSEVLTFLNEELVKGTNAEDQAFDYGFDMSLCALDSGNMRLYFSGAKLNCWVINSKESIKYRTYDKESTETYLYDNYHLIELKGSRKGIASSQSESTFVTNELELVKGDLIVLTSDGFSNQFGGPKHKKYKSSQMRELIMELGGSTPERLMNVLGSSLEDWMGDHEQVDDICVFAVKV